MNIEKSKVLIVDDEKNIQELCRIILQHMEIETDTADSAEECLKLLQSEQFDLILLDNILPGMQGVDIIKKIKMINPNIKVIMYSSDPNIQFELDSIKNGANGFIHKPFDRAELEKTVVHAL